MGQYYDVVNHSKRERIEPNFFGDSIKWPIVRGESLTGFVLFELLKGPWRGDRVAIEGDTGDESYPGAYDDSQDYQDVSLVKLLWVIENRHSFPDRLLELAKKYFLPPPKDLC